MVPLAPNYLAIERAVLECATAGCETIWIVCPSDMQPLLKYRLGEMVQDPVWINRKFDIYPSTSRKEVPIYYIEVHPRDQDKRDCDAWNILYGAKVAKKVCRGLSQWVVPNKYYVAFPNSVYPSQHLRKYRKEISNHGSFFVLTPNGDSVLDGYKVGFAFEASDLGKLIKLFWDKQSGRYDASQPLEERKNGKFVTKLLPLDKRYSGRFFKVEDVFRSIHNSSIIFKIEMEWYYDISTWENFCNFLNSEHRKKMLRPKLPFLKYRTWNKVGEDDLETI